MVIVAEMDRSMPPVVMTNAWATARTMRIAAATSIAVMLPIVRNVGLRKLKTMTRTTSPIGAAFSAQKLRCFASDSEVITLFGGAGGASRRSAVVVFTSDSLDSRGRVRGGVCFRRPARESGRISRAGW